MPGHGAEKKWKLIVTSLVVFFTCALVATMMLAKHAVKVLDQDYYRQGLDYGRQSTAAEKTSGWKRTYSFRSGLLRVTVTDSTGIPVSGAKTLFTPHQISANDAHSVKLDECEPGVYQTSVALEDVKEIRGTIFIKRDEAALSEKVALFR